MTSHSTRIRALAARGTISHDEEARLLETLEGTPPPPNRFVDPFHRFGGPVAAGAGLVIAALGLVASRFGIRYDGFLDLHASVTAPVRTALLEQVVAWWLPAALFWGIARSMRPGARLVDFVGMTGLARLPLVLVVPLLLMTLPPTPASPASFAGLKMVGLVIAALGAVTWNVTWLYQGFKNASGFRRKRLVVTFVAGIVAAEVLSKIALSFAR